MNEVIGTLYCMNLHLDSDPDLGSTFHFWCKWNSDPTFSISADSHGSGFVL
jgi:hypothetical protein